MSPFRIALRPLPLLAALATAALVASSAGGPGHAHAALAAAAAADDVDADADAIVFVTTGPTTDLARILPDGTDRQALTASADVSERSPDWSPDGAQIAYAAPRADGPVQAASAIWVLARDAAGQPLNIPLTFGPDDGAPDWAPDGRRIAFASTLERGREQQVSSLSVIAPGGADQQLVLEPLASPYARIEQPRWSPDGRRIAFVVRVTDGQAAATNPGGELYIVNADGSGARRLFAHPGWDDADPAWSPDGRWIAFSSAHLNRVPSGDIPDSGTIWRLDPSTGVAEMLLAKFDHHLDGPKWSPDGRRLIIARWNTVRPNDGPLADADLVVLDIADPLHGVPIAPGRQPDWARRPLVPSPTPAPTGNGPTPTDGPSPATTPTPPAEPATPTPPPIPGLTPFPTLAPFPTLPPPEPTFPPGPAEWPVPTATPTATTVPPASPTPTRTATSAVASSATPAPGARIFLPLTLAAAPAGDPATPTVAAPETTPPPIAEPSATPATRASSPDRPSRR